MKKKNNSMVSIIIPVYNVEKYIRRCLDSVINQTYKNLEIIVVNDGSSDESSKICEEYAVRDTRIQYISQKNMGLASARNTGLRLVSGHYIMCIDSDDFIAIDMIETMVGVAIEQKADYVSCLFKMVMDDTASKFEGKKAMKMAVECRGISKEDSLIKLFHPETKYCSAWGKLYDVSLWRDNLLYPEHNRFGEDMYLAHILIDRSKRIVNVDCEMYYYNQSGTSLVRSAFHEKKLNILKAANIWISFCEDKYPELKEEAVGFYYTNMINFFTSFLDGSRDDLYKKYKLILRVYLIIVLKNHYIGCKDKVKALMISILPRVIYKKIRKSLY